MTRGGSVLLSPGSVQKSSALPVSRASVQLQVIALFFFSVLSSRRPLPRSLLPRAGGLSCKFSRI